MAKRAGGSPSASRRVRDRVARAGPLPWLAAAILVAASTVAVTFVKDRTAMDLPPSSYDEVTALVERSQAGATIADADHDGLPDSVETYGYGSDPGKWNSSGSPIPDGWLAQFGFDPSDPTIAAHPYAQPPASALPAAYHGAWPARFAPTLLEAYRFARPANWSEQDQGPWKNGLDPRQWDGNGDGLPDAWLVAYGVDPRTSGLAGQTLAGPGGLTVRQAYENATNPLALDSDGDGLPDPVELSGHGTWGGRPVQFKPTDPNAYSTSGTGVCDGYLVGHGLDPAAPRSALDDQDRDGATTRDEFNWTQRTTAGRGCEAAVGLDPLDATSGGLDVPDGWLIRYGLDPLDATLATRATGTAAAVAATDTSPALNETVLHVRDEYRADRPSTWNESSQGPWWGGSDPTKDDSDGDGLPDAAEAQGWYVNATRVPGGAASAPKLVSSDPVRADADRDGLSDGAERGNGTSPQERDTDFDGIADGEEIALDLVLAGPQPAANRTRLSPTRADSVGDLLRDGERLALLRAVGERIAAHDSYPFPGPGGAQRSYADVALSQLGASGLGGGDDAALAGFFGAAGDVDGDGAPNLLDRDIDGDDLLNGWEAKPALYDQSPFPPVPFAAGRPATDAANADTDGDGLLDGWEVRYGRADATLGRMDPDPSLADSDADGIPDGREDPDHDSIQVVTFVGDQKVSFPSVHDNLAEQQFHTDPFLASTDGDKLLDGWKVYWGLLYAGDRHGRPAPVPGQPQGNVVLETYNGQRSSTDGTHHLPGEAEVGAAVQVTPPGGATYFVHTFGLPVAWTFLAAQSAGTNPFEPDTDHDGVGDPAEAYWSLVHGDLPLTDAAGQCLTGRQALSPLTQDAAADPDGDGVASLAEALRGADPFCKDSDRGGVDDGLETSLSSDPTRPADDTLLLSGSADADQDGLTDFAEASRKPATDPNNPDTDGDGLLDGATLGTTSNPIPANDPRAVRFLSLGIAFHQTSGSPGGFLFFGEQGISQPTVPDTRLAGVPDGWVQAHLPGSAAPPADWASCYSYGLPLWWSLAAHGPWWGGGDPSTEPCAGLAGTADADGDGLADALGEDPIPVASHSNRFPLGPPFSATPALRPAGALHSFADLDSSGAYSAGDAVVMDMDRSGAASAGDVCLSCATLAFGQVLTGAETLAGHPLQAGALGGLRFTDGNADGKWQPADEPLYDAPTGAASVAAGDVRLTATSAGAAGTAVAAGDADAGAPLAALPAGAGLGFDDGDRSGAFSAADTLYADTDGSGTLTPGDVALSGPAAGSPAGSTTNLDLRVRAQAVIDPQRTLAYRVARAPWTGAAPAMRDTALSVSSSPAALVRGLSGEVRGTLKDAATQQPVAGATVVARLGGEDYGAAFTGPDGSFVLPVQLTAAHAVAAPEGSILRGQSGSTVSWQTDVSKLAPKTGAALSVQSYARQAGDAVERRAAATVPVDLRAQETLAVDAPGSVRSGEPFQVHVAESDKAALPMTDDVRVEWAGTSTVLHVSREGTVDVPFTVTPQPGPAVLRVTTLPANPALVLPGSAEATINILAPASLQFGSLPSFLDAGTTLAVTGRLASGAASPAEAVQVSLAAPNGTAVSSRSVALGADGGFAADLDLPSGLPPGKYVVAARLAASALHTDASATRTIPLRARTALIDASPPALEAAGNRTLGARLVDASGQGLAGRTLAFTLGGQRVTAATDASGNAAAPFGFPVGAGPQQEDIAFDGDEGHQPSGLHRERIVHSASSLAATVGDGRPGDGVPVSATLLDALGKPLPGRALKASVLGTEAVALTGPDGSADWTVPLPANAPLGAAPVRVAFAGDPGGAYGPSEAGGVSTVRLGAVLSVPQPVADVGQPARALLSDDRGRPLANLTVGLVVAGKAFTSLTGPDGLLVVALGPDAPQDLPVALRFAGDSRHTAAAFDGVVSFRWPATLSAPSTPWIAGQGLALAVRADAAGGPVPLGTVVARVGNATAQAPLVAGTARLLFPDLPAGTQDVTLSLVSASHHASDLALKVPVLQPTALKAQVGAGKPGSPVRLTLTAVSAGKPLAQAVLRLHVLGLADGITVTTDRDGRADVTLPFPDGARSLQVAFDGAGQAAPASLVAVLDPTLVPAPPATPAWVWVVLGATAAAGLLVVAAALALRRRRHPAMQALLAAERMLQAGGPHQADVLACYAALQEHLMAAKVLPGPAPTPRALAGAMADGLHLGDAARRPLDALIGVFELARYGDRAIGPLHRDQARDALRDIRRRLSWAPLPAGWGLAA